MSWRAWRYLEVEKTGGVTIRVQALRGSDVVGSSVSIKIRKPSGKLFECTVQRGAIARIEAIGELFLMLTEVIGTIQNHEKLTVGDILGYVLFSPRCC
jgi:hypothetical protein